MFMDQHSNPKSSKAILKSTMSKNSLHFSNLIMILVRWQEKFLQIFKATENLFELTMTCTLGFMPTSFRRSQMSLSKFNEFSWLLAFDAFEAFNDCVLFALMRTKDVSKNRLSKCGSNVRFVANRLLNGVRFTADEHGKLIVAAFVFALKFRSCSASGRSRTFESIRVTMNFRRGADLTSSSWCLSSLFELLSFDLLPFVKLLLATSLCKWSSLKKVVLDSGELDKISLALLLIRTVFRRSPPTLAASTSVGTRYSKSDGDGETFVVAIFSAISGKRLNLASLLVVSAVALAGGGMVIVLMVSISSRSSIDAANSFSYSSLNILPM